MNKWTNELINPSVHQSVIINFLIITTDFFIIYNKYDKCLLQFWKAKQTLHTGHWRNRNSTSYVTINQQNFITNKAMSGDSNTEKDSNECDADRIYNCCPDSDMSEGWWSETSEPSLCPSIRSCVLNTFSAVNIKSDTRSSAISVIADRTACSILTLYPLWSQHLDLWIKKNPFADSLQIQQLLRICVRKRMHPQSAHLCCIEWPLTCSVRHVLSVSLLTNEPCIFDSYAWVH